MAYEFPPEPHPELLKVVMARISREERRVARRKFILFSIGTGASALAFIPAVVLFQSEVAASGFSQFFSLLVTDTGVVLSEWRNFGLLLLEVAPTLGAASIFTALLLFLVSFRSTIRELKYVRVVRGMA